MNFLPDSKVLIQGVIEPLGATYAPLMRAYGTNVVAGVSPGYGGTVQQDIRVFDMVEQALAIVGPVDSTVIFVQPYAALDAALEAIAAGIEASQQERQILDSESIEPPETHPPLVDSL